MSDNKNTGLKPPDPSQHYDFVTHNKLYMQYWETLMFAKRCRAFALLAVADEGENNEVFTVPCTMTELRVQLEDVLKAVQGGDKKIIIVPR